MKMIVLLRLLVVILLFSITMSLLTLYHESIGLFILDLHYMLHQGRISPYLTLLVIFECWRYVMMVCLRWWMLVMFVNKPTLECNCCLKESNMLLMFVLIWTLRKCLMVVVIITTLGFESGNSPKVNLVLARGEK